MMRWTPSDIWDENLIEWQMILTNPRDNHDFNFLITLADFVVFPTRAVFTEQYTHLPGTGFYKNWY